MEWIKGVLKKEALKSYVEKHRQCAVAYITECKGAGLNEYETCLYMRHTFEIMQNKNPVVLKFVTESSVDLIEYEIMNLWDEVEA